jgi:hypothetical protein
MAGERRQNGRISVMIGQFLVNLGGQFSVYWYT